MSITTTSTAKRKFCAFIFKRETGDKKKGDKCDDLAEEGGVYCTRHRNVTNRRLNDNRHEALARRMAYLEETMTLINDKMDIMMSYSFIPADAVCDEQQFSQIVMALRRALGRRPSMGELFEACSEQRQESALHMRLFRVLHNSIPKHQRMRQQDARLFQLCTSQCRASSNDSSSSSTTTRNKKATRRASTSSAPSNYRPQSKRVKRNIAKPPTTTVTIPTHLVDNVVEQQAAHKNGSLSSSTNSTSLSDDQQQQQQQLQLQRQRQQQLRDIHTREQALSLLNLAASTPKIEP
eukprot:CAMPEP_0168595114 /NCGR_PEP_ID=MMETSP0420-20121227/9276_1 /TAXON_ID=498008 /ORGANISM="Pessonella sp." /LENGTH=292 /DNA_ID=CAMNT_0008631513 /DNA_START=71 /DNA_END=946 /DNA_ORIENTATION=+